MILHELKALALREGLVDDPAFESKEVRWIIVLDGDGSYAGLRDTLQDVPLYEGKKGKPKKQMSMFAVPRRVIRSGKNHASDFLIDKSEYVLGVEPNGDRSAEDLALRQSRYMDLLNEANINLRSEPLTKVIAFLQDAEARKQCVEELNAKGYASNNLFTFRVDGDLLHEDEAIRAWWTARPVPKKKKKKQERTDRQCLMCGVEKAAVDNHNKVQVLGTSGNGAPLVGFNKPAFLKYGLEGNDNAPICRECMTAYVEGIRALLSSRSISARTGQSLTGNVRLSGDTTAVYWANIPDDLVGTLSELMYAPQKVRDVLSSPYRGQRSSGSSKRFFCLIISGAQGRAMLRSIHTGTLADLEQNLNAYFDAIRLEGDRPEPKPLGILLRSLVLQGKLDRLPPRLAGEVFLGVLFGGKLPRLVLSAAVQRNRAEQKVTSERAALLQLYFASHKQKEVPIMSLDATTKDTPYLLGRLMAVLENLQTAAQGKGLNRTIVNRFYGAASTRPGVVFPRLIELSQHHLTKVEKKHRWAGILDRDIVSILNSIDGIEFPSTLSLEEQGRFALGYYHQRAFRPTPNGGQKNDETEDTVPTTEGETYA